MKGQIDNLSPSFLSEGNFENRNRQISESGKVGVIKIGSNGKIFFVGICEEIEATV